MNEVSEMNSIEHKIKKWENNRLRYLSWSYFSEASMEQRLEQMAFQEALRRVANCHFQGDCYVSEDAHIYPDSFWIGNRTFICGGASYVEALKLVKTVVLEVIVT